MLIQATPRSLNLVRGGKRASGDPSFRSFFDCFCIIDSSFAGMLTPFAVGPNFDLLAVVSVFVRRCGGFLAIGLERTERGFGRTTRTEAIGLYRSEAIVNVCFPCTENHFSRLR